MMETAEKTKSEELIEKLGWEHRSAGVDQIALRVCPFCKNSNWKFYLNPENGCWDCKVCSKSGNYFQLRAHALQGETPLSIKDLANPNRSALPDFDAAHSWLMHGEIGGEVLDYMVAARKWSIDVIKRLKLGCWRKNDQQWLVIPYFDAKGKPVYYKARTIPPAKKGFDSPHGYEAPLFNIAALRKGVKEIICAEGEPDTIALLSNGFNDVVGVPGAGVKKSTWVDLFDEVEPTRIVILYDRDKPGQEGAKALAAKLGLDRCYNAVLPEFTLPNGEPGKDANDWFRAGRSAEELRSIIASAKQFNVAGVQGLGEVLAELEQDLEDRGTAPKYLTPWPSLTKKVGGFEDGDLVGLMAEGKVGKSTMALNWLHYYAEVEGRNVFNFCLEMPPKRTVRKWASFVTRTDDTPGRSQMTVEAIRAATAYARGEMKGEFLIGYSKEREIKSVLDTIRQVVRRYGVEVVCFDHLHLLCQSVEHQSQEIAKYAIAFKNLAMELGILIILIIQPNRVAEGQIVGARNALGSSTIEKLVDYMICLHRNRVAQIKQAEFKGYMETEDNLEPHMLVRVDLARYAPGGVCTLYMEGGISLVRECGDGESQALSKPAHVGIPVEAPKEPMNEI
jgi:KaiC/GvpD/RAD55 family RecA-like ATPase